MKLTRRGFLAALTGSTAVLAAGVTIPAATPAVRIGTGVAATVEMASPEVLAAFGLSGPGDWMELSGLNYGLHSPESEAF